GNALPQFEQNFGGCRAPIGRKGTARAPGKSWPQVGQRSMVVAPQRSQWLRALSGFVRKRSVMTWPVRQTCITSWITASAESIANLRPGRAGARRARRGSRWAGRAVVVLLCAGAVGLRQRRRALLERFQRLARHLLAKLLEAAELDRVHRLEARLL